VVDMYDRFDTLPASDMWMDGHTRILY